MALIKVSEIKLDSQERLFIGKKFLVNTDSIVACKETDISLSKEKWAVEVDLRILKMFDNECNIGEDATEIFLNNGLTFLIAEKLDYIYNKSTCNEERK